jgi:hypothetical protein
MAEQHDMSERHDADTPLNAPLNALDAKRRAQKERWAKGLPAGRPILDGTTLSPQGRKILSLYLRGFRLNEIAKIVGRTPDRVSKLCRKPAFLAALDACLGEMDQEFLRLKPDAYRAMVNGLRSGDEAIGLRASEQFFKLTGQGGYGNGAGNGARVSAEDIAQALLAAGGGTVTITAEPAAGEAPAPPIEQQPRR